MKMFINGPECPNPRDVTRLKVSKAAHDLSILPDLLLSPPEDESLHTQPHVRRTDRVVFPS